MPPRSDTQSRQDIEHDQECQVERCKRDSPQQTHGDEDANQGANHRHNSRKLAYKAGAPTNGCDAHDLVGRFVNGNLGHLLSLKAGGSDDPFVRTRMYYWTARSAPHLKRYRRSAENYRALIHSQSDQLGRLTCHDALR